MEFYISFFILFSSIFLKTETSDTRCQSAQCGHGAPHIKFPFHLQDQQTRRCGYPGFNLLCKNNTTTTTIHFPSYGELHLLSINYDIRKLNLLDPKTCVPEVFLNLNLSLTPFKYYYVVKNYTYINCSSMLSPKFTQVPCLSGSTYHVYVVESSLGKLDSCRMIKTVAIPFSYSPYISDNSFGLGFTWDSNILSELNSETMDQASCINMDNCRVLSIAVLIFIMAICLKTYQSKKRSEETVKEIGCELDQEKSVRLSNADKAINSTLFWKTGNASKGSF